MKNPTNGMEAEEGSLGRPGASPTQLPRGQDPIAAHVGSGPDGYDQGTPDYDILRKTPIAKTTDVGEGPKVAQREHGITDDNLVTF